MASGLDQNGGASKQELVRDTLLELVGGLEIGAAIPPERRLAAQLGVSRPTLRMAIDELVREGLLLRRHGSGTYVAEPKIALPLTMTSFSEDMRQRGMEPGSRVLSFEEQNAGAKLGARLRLSPATVSRILRRLGLNRIAALEPCEPVRRYEREHPGEMIHIDIKKLGRIDGIGHRITGDRRGQSSRRARGEGLGWEFVHVAIDDNSRIAFAKVMPNERKRSATAFLKAALAYYESLGVKVQRVMTDNGSCYKSFAFRTLCTRLGLKHIRTKPYTPKTNGKAERFIQTCLREWAYAQAYHHSRERTAELPYWLHGYNWHRPHAGIGAKTPISRLGLSEDNLLRLHI